VGGDERRDLGGQFAAAFLVDFLQFVGGVDVLGVDGQDLTQALFFFGVVHSHRAEPQPGILLTRIGDKGEVEHLAGLLVLAAPHQRDTLSDEVFGVHGNDQNDHCYCMCTA
jgi:hypothetical protein